MTQFRFLHFLWRVMPRKSVWIKGVRVEYLAVPWWLLWRVGVKPVFGSAVGVAHIPSKTRMIFISHRCAKEKNLRYTLFHEWYEAQIRLRMPIPRNRLSRLFARRIEAFRPSYPELLEAFREHREKHGDLPHVIAILMELTLAQRELSPEDFRNMVMDSIENRL